MSRVQGASLRDRAVVNGAASVSALRASVPSAGITHAMANVLAFGDLRRLRPISGTLANGLVQRSLAEYIPTALPHRRRFVFTGDGLVLRARLRRSRARCDCGKLAKYVGPPLYILGSQPKVYCAACVPIGCSCRGPKLPCVDYLYHRDGILRMPQPEYDAFVRASIRRAASAIEARSGETRQRLDPKDESAAPKVDAQPSSGDA